MPSPNRKQQRLARALASNQGIGYQQALKLVLTSAPEAAELAPTATEFPFALIDTPRSPTGGLVPLGIHPERDVAFGMRAADLDSHLLVSGSTGTGKSELLKWLALGAVKAGYPLVVIDPHGTLSEDLLNVLVVSCPERAGDIVFCDLGAKDWPVAVNPLDVCRYEDIESVVYSLTEALSAQLGVGGASAPYALNLATQALQALCEANLHIKDPEVKCNLLHLLTFLTDVEFRRLTMEFCSNVAVRHMFDPESGPFELFSQKQQWELAMPVLRALHPLSTSESFSGAFGASQNRLDLPKLIAQRSIVLVKLARFSHQKKLGEFAGQLILPWLFSTIDYWGRRRNPVSGECSGNGARIIIDEAPSVIPERSSVVELLSATRKWDAGAVFACQYPDQFPSSVLQGLMANTMSKLSLRLDAEEAQRIANMIAGASGSVDAADIAELPNYTFWANLLTGANHERRTSGPVRARCLPPLSGELDERARTVRSQVLTRSHALVCRRREDVEERRLHALEHVKGALGQLLVERADAAEQTGYPVKTHPLAQELAELQATLGPQSDDPSYGAELIWALGALAGVQVDVKEGLFAKAGRGEEVVELPACCHTPAALDGVLGALNAASQENLARGSTAALVTHRASDYLLSAFVPPVSEARKLVLRRSERQLHSLPIAPGALRKLITDAGVESVDEVQLIEKLVGEGRLPLASVTGFIHGAALKHLGIAAHALRLGLLPPEALASMTAALYQMGSVVLANTTVEQDAASLLRPDQSFRWQILPYSRDPLGRLLVAISNPRDVAARENLHALHPREEIVWVYAIDDDLSRAIKRTYGKRSRGAEDGTDKSDDAPWFFGGW